MPSDCRYKDCADTRGIKNLIIIPENQILFCDNDQNQQQSEEESVTESLTESIQSAFLGFEKSVESINSTMKESAKDITDTIEERLRGLINQTVEVKLKEITQTVEKNISTLEKNMTTTVEKNVCNSTNENVEMIIKSATQLFNSINNSHMKSTASTKNTFNESPQFDILCNSCYAPIRGKRWRCETCEDFDLCSTCKCHMTHHPDHKFKFIKDDVFDILVLHVQTLIFAIIVLVLCKKTIHPTILLLPIL
ncbi:hypothetical protein G6F52_012701 [Rhizopus delemar]|nr:hypothetical protein G6F52_012701 [Rhizopus delemar]